MAIDPIHHHLEAIGWTQPQITMRFWLLGLCLQLQGQLFNYYGLKKKHPIFKYRNYDYSFKTKI